jgi:hypothetical protein
MTVVVESWFVDGLQDEPDAFLDDFVAWRGHSQGTVSFFFGDVRPPDWSGSVLLLPQQVNVFLYVIKAVSIQCFSFSPRRHVTGLTFQSFVGHDVQRRIVEQPVQTPVLPVGIFPILLVDDIQDITGFYHIS